ncbi:MAG: LemA family protein [Chthoniobacteraceae bacterium]
MDTWMLLGIPLIVAIVVIAMINSLIGKKNQVNFAFASIDAQLKKRYDLVPNLVAACEKYMGYEEKVLKDLTETRTKILNGGDNEKVALEGVLSTQLRSVFAVAENYPQLKAIDNFVMLERSLNEVEEQLAASRRAFNAAVTVYNNAVEMFPTNIVASLLGYKLKTLFEIPPEERQPVKVWR